MKCPHCGKSSDKVVDSRPAAEEIAIRRRRECLSCGDRFTTFESTENQMLSFLIKKNIPREARINNTNTSVMFLLTVLNALEEGVESLIKNVNRTEKARAKVIGKSKRGTQAEARGKKRARVKSPPVAKPIRLTDTAQVLKVIKRHKRGIDLKKLRASTGFHDDKIRGIVFRACKMGKIKRISRGLYISA
ncbi:MAG: hypothetical protein HQ561_03845 [Desulfobacteraceae bacterium]|nr:hypothetical protein [Desulfobacteraceae bacterium]